jgi:hypothetical protein
MRGELDCLVPPLRGAIHARDQARAMDAAEVSVHEGVSRLGLLVRTVGETEMPCAVLARKT